MDAITSDTITRGRTKWWIDWPPPKSTDTDEPTKSSPETSKTKKDDPKSTVMTEESTITDGMTTKTDSGRTVTVPNSEVVTITRHTTIVTDKPSPSTSVPESTINPSRPNQSGAEQTSPPPSAGASGDSGSQGGGPLPTGAIVGIGIGGAAIVVFLVITAIMIKRRVKRRREEQETGTAQHNTGRDDRFDEKQFSQQMSAHTTGTQGSGDPFAPFGGRADSEYPNRPASNTFEMDATVAAPVELPDTSPGTTPAPTASGTQQSSPVADNGPADPRANLNSLGNENGRPQYVNHWNQYRSMSSG